MKKILNNLILMCSKYIDPEKAHALAIFFLKIHFLNKIYRPQNFKNLKWEITRNGEFFPHYFGYLKFENILYSFRTKGKNNFY